MDPKPHNVGVSEVFSRNLRQLVAARPSISAVCRSLEINRTQFNRYLSGAAHPRPEVLEKICSYFERDARILLQPLAEIDVHYPGAGPDEIDPSPFLRITTEFDHSRMPDGIYWAISPSFTDRDGVIRSLIGLRTLKNGSKGVIWVVPRDFAEHGGSSTHWRDRKALGYCMQQADGVSMSMASHHSRLFMLFFVSPGYRGHSNIHTGYAALTQARGTDQTQVQPLVIEQVPSSWAAKLAARRQLNAPGQPPLSDLHKHYLKSWTPGWERR